jgi:RNA polymerase sigma-70 factor (ECF subfamily)
VQPPETPFQVDDSPRSSDVSEVVENLFRHEGARMVATLTRVFGVDNLGLAEDVVQEALIRALQTWPYHGVPDNPAAWIMRASRNLALDQVRRGRRFREKMPAIVAALGGDGADGAAGGHEVPDDRLRMLFVCCHPAIPAESQVALALKVLGGFSAAEIASAFLATEAAIAKRLTRARHQLREAGVSFAIPEGPELSERLGSVLRSLYLLFNEGYKASSGDRLVREDICREAIRLTGLLAAHPAGDRPPAHALLALMLLNAARLPARLDAGGGLLLLREQDRSRWDQAMIARGMFHLARSATGDSAGEYHLQAAIAACHCAAPGYEATDWRKILALYDRLAALDPSPVVALNRAVAVAEVRGPQAGLDALAGVAGSGALGQYCHFHAVLGELEARLSHAPEASVHFRRALELAATGSERAFLADRLRACDAASAGAVRISRTGR